MTDLSKSPKSSGKHIASIADHVKIDDKGIDKCVEEVLTRIEDGRLSLKLNLYKKAGEHPTTIEDKDVEWVFLTSALNFSFWKDDHDPQYLVTFKGKTQNGYMSMCAAINRTLEQGIPLTDPGFYGKITEDELEKYFIGDDNVSCPMIKQRVECLHEISKVLFDKYQGGFVNCLKKSEGSALKLLSLVTENFQCFNDGANYKGNKVVLHKRAQILVADLWQLFEGKGLCDFSDIGCITMFADYRVPQSLQFFGAFQYSDSLFDYLNSEKLLESGDPLEVEIRGCSIEAVERIVAKVNEKLEDEAKSVNAIQMDNFLWGFRREKAEEMKTFPYHRVRSIYY